MSAIFTDEQRTLSHFKSIRDALSRGEDQWGGAPVRFLLGQLDETRKALREALSFVRPFDVASAMDKSYPGASYEEVAMADEKIAGWKKLAGEE